MTFPPETTPTPLLPSGEPSSGSVRRIAVLVVVVSALAGAGIAHVLWPAGSSSRSSASSQNGGFVPFGGGFRGGTAGQNADGSAPSGSAAAASQATAAVAARIDPGVVDINTITSNGIAAGTGMVVTSAGEVLTNNHVIAGAQRITAQDFGNGRTYTARVVGYDRSDDIAVLKLVGASGLATVPIGDSSSLRTGAGVVSIGNAGGVGGTPATAAGSVAGLGRSITAADAIDGSYEHLTGLIEIAGRLLPGDSGGPLASTAGKVVGMDTAAATNFNFQPSSNQGYAIPIAKVLAIGSQIVAGHASNSIHIGASALIGVLVAGQRAQYCTNSSPPGVTIAGVVPNSPGSAAGLAPCDTITSVNGTAVTSPNALKALIDMHHPGDLIRLVWLDPTGANQHSGTVRLMTAPPD